MKLDSNVYEAKIACRVKKNIVFPFLLSELLPFVQILFYTILVRVLTK